MNPTLPGSCVHATPALAVGPRPETGDGPAYCAAMEPLLLVVAALVAILYAWWRHEAARRRREAMRAFATKAGLGFSASDHLGLVALPFRLLDKGDGREVANVCSGSVGELDVALFDFTYHEVTTDAKGNRHRRYYHHSCVVGSLGGVWVPHLTIKPEGVLSRLADAVGLRDVEFESEEFNRAFQVTGGRGRFPYALVDAGMMTWLLAEARNVHFEVAGDRFLAATDRLPPQRLWDLLGIARGFRAHVPGVVASLYPGAEAGAP